MVVCLYTDIENGGVLIHRHREWWCAYTQTERMVVCLYTDIENGGVLIHRQREWWCAYTQTERVVVCVSCCRRSKDSEITVAVFSLLQMSRTIMLERVSFHDSCC